jgi:glycosyltransferase involved in cell wall biosynthesis
LGLENRAHFPGATSDPASALQAADMFILSSRNEGFPNVLCEAMACGLPVIAFDCANGPAEVIRNNVDGILVPPSDVNALASAMERLMADATECERLASRARDVTIRFSSEKVLKEWQALVEATISHKFKSRDHFDDGESILRAETTVDGQKGRFK